MYFAFLFLPALLHFSFIFFPSLQSEMGLATEQLSQQLLDYEKKVSIDEKKEVFLRCSSFKESG